MTARRREPATSGAGVLYLVATPIGNLADISARALDVLRDVDGILAEDTRRTRKLLSHYAIPGALHSYHEHNERAAAPAVLERLARGETLALVSDAGTPTVSDPGYRLVRAATRAGIRVVPVPGPSAVIAALIGSALPTDCFTFVGYLPRKRGERRRVLHRLATLPGTLVILESPRRLHGALRDAAVVLGEDRPAAVARELTKAHEEFLRGTLATLVERLGARPARGEVTVCIGAPEGSSAAAAAPEPERLRGRYTRLLAAGAPRRDALRLLALEHGVPRRRIYAMILDGRKADGQGEGRSESHPAPGTAEDADETTDGDGP